MALTNKQKVFINEYLKCWNATEAARRAKYKGNDETLASVGCENLRKPNIRAVIEERLKDNAMEANEVISRLSDIGRGDISDFMDISSVGYNLDLHKAKEAGLTHLIKKVKQKTTTFIAKKESDEDREVTELELELYPADSALVNLGRMHELFTDKTKSDGEMKVIIEYADGQDNLTKPAQSATEDKE